MSKYKSGDWDLRVLVENPDTFKGLHYYVKHMKIDDFTHMIPVASEKAGKDLIERLSHIDAILKQEG